MVDFAFLSLRRNQYRVNVEGGTRKSSTDAQQTTSLDGTVRPLSLTASNGFHVLPGSLWELISQNYEAREPQPSKQHRTGVLVVDAGQSSSKNGSETSSDISFSCRLSFLVTYVCGLSCPVFA